MTGILAALRLVPWWAWAGAALLATIGWQRVELGSVTAGLLREQRDRKDERLRLAERALTAIEQNQQETQRRLAAQQEAIDATQAQLDAARAAAALVPDLDRRVRAATLAVLACRRAAAPDPAAAAGSAPADQTTIVLAELQRVAQEAAAERARYADEAAGAGAKCERIYDSLNITPGLAVTGAE